MPRCSSQQQAEQESSPTLGTSVLRAMAAPESRWLALAAVAQLRGVVGLQDHRKPWRRILMPCIKCIYGVVVGFFLVLEQGRAPSRELGRRGPRRHPRGLRHNLLARLGRLGRRAPGLHVMPAWPCQSCSSVLDPP